MVQAKPRYGFDHNFVVCHCVRTATFFQSRDRWACAIVVTSDEGYNQHVAKAEIFVNIGSSEFVIF